MRMSLLASAAMVFVLAAARDQLADPATLRMGVTIGPYRHGTGAVDQQYTQTSIPALGDGAELRTAAGTVLLGNQADPREQLRARLNC